VLNTQLISAFTHVTGSNMSSGGSAGLAKMQPTQKNETDAAQTSKTASNQPPAMLEEDDEFEDFPVEGLDTLRQRSGHSRYADSGAQIGHKKTPKYMVDQRTYGRKAGTTTTRMKISVNS
jgi:hypothetical protein